MAKYATQSFFDGEEGVVSLRVLVRKNGSVGETQIAVSSGSQRLDKSAQDTIKDWRYLPATVNGTPVDTWIPVNVVWALLTLRFNLSPEQVKNMSTYYPAASVRNHEVGGTIVRFLVTPNGTIAKVLVDRSSGYQRLDDATIRMVKSGFRFSPATLKTGETVGTWFRLEVRWALDGAIGKPDEPCFTALSATDADSVVQSCTQLLKVSNLTPYEKALAFKADARAHLFKHEFDQAIADLDAGIRFSPGFADLFLDRARAHVAKGQRDFALSDVDTAMQVEPLNYEPYLARALMYFNAGAMDQSLADFRRAMGLPTVNMPALFTSRCNFLTRIGRPQDGLADCDKSLGLNPRDKGALETRGHAYLKLGQYQRAIQDYDAALGQDEHLSGSLYARGIARLKLGDATGETDVTAAKAVNPYIGEDLVELGIAP